MRTEAAHIFLAAVLGLLLAASPAAACDCFGRPTCAAFWDTQVAFVGTVKETVWSAPRTQATTLIVEEWLRGEAVKKEVTIESVGVGFSCDYEFSPAIRYLVFAYKVADGSWKAFLCGGTTPVESDNGKAVLKEIRAALKSREPGRVSGHVAFDEDPAERVMPGAAIIQAVVTLQNAQTTFTTRTDARGDFGFARVPVGRYSLSVALPPSASSVPPMDVVVGAKACVERYILPHRRQ